LHDTVGKARHRHGQGIDGLALRCPFGRDGIGDRALRHQHDLAGRRLDWLAVERDGEAAIGFADADLLVKPLARRRPRRLAHRLPGIERRMAGDFFEQFTHPFSVSTDLIS
jgi:hypothetical protein